MRTKRPAQTSCERCGNPGPCQKAIKPPFLSQFVPYEDRYKDKRRWCVTNLCRACYDQIVSLKELP